MTEITKQQQENINRVLKENNLIEKINTIFIENGLSEYKIKSLQLQHVDALSKFPLRDCPEGFELQWICHEGTNCELKCMPLG